MSKREELKLLLIKAQDLMDQSATLKVNAEWISNEIDRECDMMDEDGYLDQMNEEERTKKFNKLQELLGRLNTNTKILIEVDRKYRELATKVNEVTGKKVMEILPPLDLKSLLGEEDL